MRRCITFLLFISFSLSIWASTVEVLKNELVTALPKERVLILKSLSEKLIYRNPEESIYYSEIGLEEVDFGSEDYIYFLLNKGMNYEIIDQADSALVCYQKLNLLAIDKSNYELKAQTQLSMGTVYSTQEDFTTSLTFLNKALDLFLELGQEDKQANCYNEIGYCYEMKSMHAEALENYFKAYEINLNINNITGLGNSTVNIGNVYNSLKNNERSLEYYKLGRKYYSEVEDIRGLSSVFNNIGNIYDENGEIELALEYYRKSLDLTDPITEKNGYAITLNNIAAIHLELKEYDKAYDSTTHALKIALEQDNKQNIVSSKIVLYHYFIEVNREDSAFVYLQDAYKLAKQEDQKDMIEECYQFFSKYYKNRHDYKQALEYSEKYIALHDSIFGEVSEEIALIQSSYENIEKKIEIEALTKEKELQDKLRYYLIFLIIVLLVLALLFFSLFKHKQREVAIIEEMEKNKKQETSLRSIIYNVSKVADETNNLDKVYHAIQTNFSKVIDTSNFFIAFYNDEDESFSCPLSNDSKDSFIEYPAGKTLSAYVLRKRKGFLGSNKDIQALVQKGQIIQIGTASRCWLGVPLYVGGIALGIMAVQDYENEDAYNTKDLEMMNFFSSQISNILMRIITDNNLKESEKRFRILTQNSNAAIFTVDKRGYFTFVNPAVVKLSGYSKEELVKIKATDITHPDHHAMLAERISQRIEGRSFGDSQYRFVNKSGEIRWMELSSSVINLKGESYILCSALDITESKIHEETILTSLNEKEILLKEIHHRVKNNMQIISSLLKLQSKYTDDDKVRELFEISQDRVRSMSLVHEKLYASPDLANIHIESYIRNLISHLQASYIHNHEQIKVKYDLDELDIDINNAIPCGLILNELLTNCLKYAFPDGRKGLVIVRFKNEVDNYLFSVEDDGIGMPENFVIEDSDSLGLQLVSSLVIQLHGTLEVDNSKGSSFIIKFPRVDNKKLT